MTTTFFGNHLWLRYTFMAIHTVLLLFLLFFTLFTTWDILLMIFHVCAAGMIVVYLLPAAILSIRGRESGYERGWVEMMYITYQVLWSWASLIWVGLIRDPSTCSGAYSGESGYLPWYYPFDGLRFISDSAKTRRLCDLFTVVIVFSVIHTIVLMSWFAWTLWLSNKAARTMGEPWNRDLVLKKISMGKISKLHQWREGEGVRMGKMSTNSENGEDYRPQKHNKFNGLIGA